MYWEYTSSSNVNPSSSNDISKITHVKLIDVIGTIDPVRGSQDSQGHIINDLFPTEFPSGGFDLDGLAVIHEVPLSVDELELDVSIYPNPTSDFITVNVQNESSIRIVDISGKELINETIIDSKMIDVSIFDSSVLFVELSSDKGRKVERIILRK